MKDKELNKNFFGSVCRALILQSAVVALLIVILFSVKFIDAKLFNRITHTYKTAVNAPTDIGQVKDPQKPQENSEITAEDITDSADSADDSDNNNTSGSDADNTETPNEPNTDKILEEEVSSVNISYICDLKVDSSSNINSIIWPVTGTITSNFGGRNDPFTGGSSAHGGIDIAVVTGTPVKAATAGKVVKAEYNNLYGNYVILEHSGSFKTVYAHCSELCVNVGQTVKQGEIIAKSGSTGRSTGPHLHFEIRIGDKKVNPRWLLPEVADI